MDQVGFEPTSSRLPVEVTLPYTRSNLIGSHTSRVEKFFSRGIANLSAPARIAHATPIAIRAGQPQSGGTLEKELPGVSPTSLTDEVTLLLTIPESSAQAPLLPWRPPKARPETEPKGPCFSLDHTQRNSRAGLRGLTPAP
jgi:hypothetical protein